MNVDGIAVIRTWCSALWWENHDSVTDGGGEVQEAIHCLRDHSSSRFARSYHYFRWSIRVHKHLTSAYCQENHWKEKQNNNYKYPVHQLEFNQSLIKLLLKKYTISTIYFLKLNHIFLLFDIGYICLAASNFMSVFQF